MRAALKIIADVARYRLLRLEMANLVAATALMMTLRNPVWDLLARLGFGAALNLLVYLNNDFHDLDDDLASETKDRPKTLYLQEHRGAAVLAQIGLAATLVVAALVYDLGLLVPLVVGGGICWAYSAVLKRRPFVDVVAMIAWGASMPLVAFELDVTVGWILVGQLALFSGVFESIQVLRDHDEDAAIGVRTTAVVLGAARTTAVLRAIMIAAATYAALCVSPWAGLLAASVLALPMGGAVDKYWNRVRLVLGLAFVAECATVWLTGSTQGLLWQVPVGHRL